LVLVADRGHAVQETLPVVDELQRAGAGVVLGTVSDSDVRFCPVCNALAFAESLWAPSWRLLRQARHNGILHNVTRPDGAPGEWAARFDALVVPGGHGKVYGAFASGPTVVEAVHAFHEAGKPVGLVCHSVAAAALPGPRGQRPLASGKHVTCWPRSLERVFGAVPLVGRYFVPFGTYVQTLLERVTPRVECATPPWRTPHAVTDGLLVTSWGPWSGTAFARALMQRLARG
jgi:putative intracellular protease/amidase